ncbi:MAG: hypothetical protein ABI743_01640 [bacterium]
MTVSRFSLLGLTVVLAGCSQSAGPTPASPSAPPVVSVTAQGTDQLLAQYELTIDPLSLNATIDLLPVREGSSRPPQTLNYDVDLTHLLKPGALKILSVSRDGDGDFVISYRHTHPMAAPDLTQPPTARNRADLGYTGRLLFLASGAPQPFFNNTITLDPTVIKHPDGYVDAGDLLAHQGLTANTFPYQLLVDETRDNREQVSNNFRPVGNYDARDGGWQRANLGATNDQWHGYDFLHAGQSALGSFTMRQGSGPGGAVKIGLALLVKYSDPKGGTARSFFLPPETVDPTVFAYRLPYAGLDCSQLVSDTPLLVGVEQSRTTTVQVRLRDWDATATEATQPDLSLEGDVSLVQPGASGYATLDMDCPALAVEPTDPFIVTYGGSGLSWDLTGFQGSLRNAMGVAQPGRYYGVIRAIDPEDNDPLAADYRFGLDPTTLVPDAARALAVRTYQVVPVEVRSSFPASFAYLWGGLSTINQILDQTIDPAGNIYVGGFVARNGNPGTPSDLDPTAGEDLHVVNGAGDPFIAKFAADGGYLWGRTFGNDAVNGVNSDAVTGLVFDPLSNTLVATSRVMGTVDLDPGAGTFEVTSPGFQNFHTAISQFTPDGDFLTGGAFGSTPDWEWTLAESVAADGAGHVIVGGTFQSTVDFDPGPGTREFTAVGISRDAFIAEYTVDAQLVDVWVLAGSGDENLQDVAVSNDAILATGSFRDTDFDPGAGEAIRKVAGLFSTDAYLVKLDRSGAFQWVDVWGDPNDYQDDTAMGVTLNSSGQIGVVGAFKGEQTDFDPGPGTDIHPGLYKIDGFLLVLDGSGNEVWARTWDGPLGDSDSGQDVVVDRNGNWIVAGSSTPGDGDASVLQFTASGAPMWERNFFTNESGVATGIAVTPDDHLVLTGVSSPTTDLDPGPAQDLRSEGAVPLLLMVRLNGEGLRD